SRSIVNLTEVSGTATHDNRTVLVAGSLSNAGLLDLNSNDVIVHNGEENALRLQLRSAFTGGASGTWSGASGITSSSAHADSRKIIAIGTRPQSSTFTSFDGVSLNTSDVAMKETFFGDATLDGTVDAADYSLIDFGYASQGNNAALTGWSNG